MQAITLLDNVYTQTPPLGCSATVQRAGAGDQSEAVWHGLSDGDTVWHGVVLTAQRRTGQVKW